MRVLAALWAGQLSLGRAFWVYAVIGGLLINGYATLLSFATIAAQGPSLLAIALHLAPIPWNVLASVGVWRSAQHPAVSRERALAAKCGVIGLFALMLVL